MNGLLRSTAALLVSGTALGAAASQPRQSAGAADMNQRSAPLTIGETLRWHIVPMPEEKHATIYHPAALRAFRTLFKP